MAVATTAERDASALIRPRRFTIDELEAMVQAGIVRMDEHVELIDGQIVEMHAQGTRHIWGVSRVMTVFARRDDVVVTPQSTFRIHGQVSPEPDVAVLRATASQSRKPSPRDAMLLIEVAATSLAYDQTVKGPLYARAGIPEYWIVDLNGERIEVYSEPSAAGYRASRIYLRGETLSPAFAPDLSVAADDILPPPEIVDDDDDEDQVDAPS